MDIKFLTFLVIAYTLYKSLNGVYKLHAFRKTNINEIDNMSGIDFEKYLESLLRKMGYSVKRTQATGDYGADLIISTAKGYKAAIQAKRYKKNVGIKAVQEIVSAKAFYRCSDAWVITNSHFTKQANNLARMNNVSLIDRESLIKIIIKANKNRQDA